MTKPRASLVHFSFFWSVSGQEVDPENFALLTPPNFINQLLCSYAFKNWQERVFGFGAAVSVARGLPWHFTPACLLLISRTNNFILECVTLLSNYSFDCVMRCKLPKSPTVFKITSPISEYRHKDTTADSLLLASLAIVMVQMICNVQYISQF